MDWLLKFILAPIGKYFTSHFPWYEEDALQVALKYGLIYAQSGYVYTVMPNLPQPGGCNASGVSHATNSIIGSISHSQPPPYTPPLMSYGQPQGVLVPLNTYPPPNTSCGNIY